MKTSKPLTQEVILFPALTIEFALYGALTFVAFIVRMLGLGDAPLNADEARQALASLNFVRGTPDAFTGSPLLFTFNAILFALFGASDAAVRFFPTLFGSALVLLPALLRRDLGRIGALVASALLAFSPSLIFFSRQSGGAIIAVTCALATLAFFWRYIHDIAARTVIATLSNAKGKQSPIRDAEIACFGYRSAPQSFDSASFDSATLRSGSPLAMTEERARDLYLASASAALALLAAREVWTVVLALALFWLGAKGAKSAKSFWHVWLVWLVWHVASVFLAIATTFMLHRDGIGAAFELFGAWLDGLRPGDSLFDPLHLLVVYEPLALFVGVFALVDVVGGVWRVTHGETLVTRHPSLVTRLALVFWIVVAFILYSIGADKDPARVVVLVVPLALVAGWYIGAWVERAAQEVETQTLLTQETPVFLLACAVAAFLYLVLAEFATRGSVVAADALTAILGVAREGRADFSAAIIWTLFVASFGAVTLLAVTMVGWARARHLGFAIMLTLLTAWTIRQAALVNFSGALNPQEYLIARAASPNVRDLVRDVEDVSRWRANDTHSLRIAVDPSLGPIAAWALRDFRYARFAARPVVTPLGGAGSATQDIQAMLLPSNAPTPAANWISQRYRLETTRRAPPPNFLRWLIFREAGSVESVDAVLWMPVGQ